MPLTRKDRFDRKIGEYEISYHGFARYIERCHTKEYLRIFNVAQVLISQINLEPDVAFLCAYRMLLDPKRFEFIINKIGETITSAREVEPIDDSIRLRYEIINDFRKTKYLYTKRVLFVVREQVIVTVVVGLLHELFKVK